MTSFFKFALFSYITLILIFVSSLAPFMLDKLISVLVFIVAILFIIPIAFLSSFNVFITKTFNN